jgi:hypothetical protein
MKRTPKVNEVNEFLEIASDFEDPLEVIRESLSNAYDANATEVEIEVRSREMGSDIVIEDDGHGMNERDLESFFDLGNSRKTDSIGYKGHGTKIFYKSDQIVVNTVRDGISRRAVMEEPWRKLNDRELPQYEVTERETRSANSGTRIKVHNFRSGKGFAPEQLTYNKIDHYLNWKTIAGAVTCPSDEHDPVDDMTITVTLGDEIDDTRDQLVTTSSLQFPEEQLEPGDGDFPEERMCKHYDRRELEVEYDGGTTTVDIIGMIGGKAARNELPTYGRHSAQFGVWLAKDDIKVEQYNEAISHDNEFLHFFFIANCQEFELSANRETIRNKTSDVYQAACEEIEYYMSKVVQDPWFKRYLEIRREAKLRRRAKSQRNSLDNRRERITNDEQLEPTNRTELILAIERAARELSDFSFQIQDYRPDSDVNAVATRDGRLRNTALHLTLTDHFAESRSLANVETIVYWDIGDRSELQELERKGYIGGQIELALDDGYLVFEDEGRQHIDLIELSTVLETRAAVATADD